MSSIEIDQSSTPVIAALEDGDQDERVVVAARQADGKAPRNRPSAAAFSGNTLAVNRSTPASPARAATASSSRRARRCHASTTATANSASSGRSRVAVRWAAQLLAVQLLDAGASAAAAAGAVVAVVASGLPLGLGLIAGAAAGALVGARYA